MFKNAMLTFVISAWFLQAAAWSSVLSSTAGSDQIEEVKISKEAKVSIADRSANLKLLGAGLRYKKIAFFKAKVYVAELFMDSPEKFTKTREQALASVDNQKTMALRLTFLRDVEGEKIEKSFREGLEENKVSISERPVKSFLGAVKNGGEAKKNSTLVFVGEKLADGKELLSYENAKGILVTVPGTAGFMKSIFSIWFGKIDDSGLESLRDSFLGLKK